MTDQNLENDGAMLVLGLTGNIASGKSEIASMFRDMGAEVIDADIIARDIVKPDTPAWKEIIEYFGDEILNDDRSINRKELGDLVFSDPEKRNKLNEITHPRIIETIYEKLEDLRKQNTPVAVIEAALIVEKGGMKGIIDKLLVVSSSEDEQVRRLKMRDGIDPESALARVKSQMPVSEKIKFADYVIDNSGSLENTRKQVRKIMDELLGE